MSDSFVIPSTVACWVPLFSTISQGLFKFMSVESVILSNHLILCHSLLLLPSAFPSTRVFSSELALCIKWLSIETSVSASVLPMNIQGWFPLVLTDLISLLSQESSLAPQVKSISSLALSLLCGPTFTSVHDYWKNDSFNYRDVCQQNDVSAF